MLCQERLRRPAGDPVPATCAPSPANPATNAHVHLLAAALAAAHHPAVAALVPASLL